MNCWEFKKCGRIPGGDKVAELGVCPAWPNFGNCCACVAGTFCKGEPQGSFAKKIHDCMRCDFYTSGEYHRHTPAT